MPVKSYTQLVGICSEELHGFLEEWTEVIQVYAALETIAHYQEQHAGQFDVDKAAGLLGTVIENPDAIYKGLKYNTLVFTGSYDAEYLLIAPIKVLRQEMWLESMYIDNADRFQRRRWVRMGLLYRK